MSRDSCFDSGRNLALNLCVKFWKQVLFSFFLLSVFLVYAAKSWLGEELCPSL